MEKHSDLWYEKCYFKILLHDFIQLVFLNTSCFNKLVSCVGMFRECANSQRTLDFVTDALQEALSHKEVFFSTRKEKERNPKIADQFL